MLQMGEATKFSDGTRALKKAGSDKRKLLFFKKLFNFGATEDGKLKEIC